LSEKSKLFQAMLDQSFQVLPRCDHHSFDIDFVQASQSETPQAVKIFGFTKQGLNSHASLKRCFLVGLGLIVSLHLFDIFLMEITKYGLSTFAAGALNFDRTSIKHFCVCSINKFFFTLAS